MFWERDSRQRQLSPEINALMKDTVLGFKYWVDEPGDTVMYMGSENHRLLFHVAEWMAGLLFPTEEFTNSRQNGLFHSQRATSTSPNGCASAGGSASTSGIPTRTFRSASRR